MKNLFTIALLMMAFSTQAQDYIPLPPDPSSEWRIDEETWNPYPWEITTYYNRYFFDGDTVIGGKTYQKQYRSGEMIYQPPDGFPPVIYSFEYIYKGAYLTEGSQLMYAPNGEYPQVVFDYAVQVGDTLKDCMIAEECYGTNQIVISIDSIQIAGRYHLRYNFDPEGFAGLSFFIEGIGHDFGIYHNGCMTPDRGSTLQCYAENGIPIFPEDASCVLNVDIAELTKEDAEIKIYPNPSSGNVSVIYNSAVPCFVSVKIIDPTGNEMNVQSWALNQGINTKSIDLSNLDLGIYFLIMTSENGEKLQARKIILN